MAEAIIQHGGIWGIIVVALAMVVAVLAREVKNQAKTAREAEQILYKDLLAERETRVKEAKEYAENMLATSQTTNQVVRMLNEAIETVQTAEMLRRQATPHPRRGKFGE